MAATAPDPTSLAQTTSPGKRDRARGVRERTILDAAAQLFYERGVHEVGMDELVAATGLSKPAVYRVFGSKDELIGAYLHRLSDTILALVDADRARLSPADALHAVLDAVDEDLHRPAFRGCPFNNASVEFPDPEHPARRSARTYRQGLHTRLVLLCHELRSQSPGEGEGADDDGGRGRPHEETNPLADQLAVLIDGAYVSSVHLGPDGPARTALALGHRLIEEAAS